MISIFNINKNQLLKEIEDYYSMKGFINFLQSSKYLTKFRYIDE